MSRIFQEVQNGSFDHCRTVIVLVFVGEGFQLLSNWLLAHILTKKQENNIICQYEMMKNVDVTQFDDLSGISIPKELDALEIFDCNI